MKVGAKSKICCKTFMVNKQISGHSPTQALVVLDILQQASWTVVLKEPFLSNNHTGPVVTFINICPDGGKYRCECTKDALVQCNVKQSVFRLSYLMLTHLIY